MSQDYFSESGLSFRLLDDCACWSLTFSVEDRVVKDGKNETEFFFRDFICSGWAASAAIMTGMFLTLISPLMEFDWFRFLLVAVALVVFAGAGFAADCSQYADL